MLPAVVRRFVGERCALVYLWFAEPYDSLHIVLLARLFGVRTVIVAGGYDIAWQPLIGYGALSNGASHRKVKKALQSADAVLPFSRFSAAEIGDLGRTRGVRVIYPGVDCGYFAPAGDRERLVVTAGTIAETVWLRKGLDVFARCARLCRELRFLIIGHCASPRLRAELQALGGDNLEFTDTRIGREQLLQCYRRSSVYAQLSTHEGFGLALAEAMSCECVPVATSIGSLPEVVGDTGFLVAPGDATAAAAAIAHARDADLGVRARQRIKNLFALETRERQLLDTVAQVLAVGSA
jgi:glycosyltransferase involved in cell wall biosynthesis